MPARIVVIQASPGLSYPTIVAGGEKRKPVYATARNISLRKRLGLTLETNRKLRGDLPPAP
ncbi:protein of unknown function [Cupriavidus taiwanensis]|nr:protein of unknown function [Cupriavidus taiwanensis]